MFCGIRQQDFSHTSFEFYKVWGGIRLVCLGHPIDAQSVGDLRNLKSRSIPWTLCHVSQTIPDHFFPRSVAGSIILLREVTAFRAHSPPRFHLFSREASVHTPQLSTWCKKKDDSTYQATFFHCSLVQYWWSHAHVRSAWALWLLRGYTASCNTLSILTPFCHGHHSLFQQFVLQ